MARLWVPVFFMGHGVVLPRENDGPTRLSYRKQIFFCRDDISSWRAGLLADLSPYDLPLLGGGSTVSNLCRAARHYIYRDQAPVLGQGLLSLTKKLIRTWDSERELFTTTSYTSSVK